MNQSAQPRQSFPRRDDHGRVAGLPDLLALTVAGLVTGYVVLLVVDGTGAVLGWGTFGEASGWLALILPAWLFLIEELRAWRAVRARLAVVISGGLLAMALGLLVAGATAGPPVVSSGAGAAVAAVAYAVYWFYGIRWLAGREGGSR